MATTKTPLKIGLVGYGFMGRTHSNAFAQVNHFFDLPYQPVLQAVCARDAAKLAAFAAQWGYASTETDWRKLIDRPDIDLIDIASPNNTHAEIAIAAAGAGKMVLCEKPLGFNAAEAERMVAAVEKAGVPNMVWYNYRRVPAVVLAKQLIDEGRLGKIFHYRAKFLQDWTISADLPQGGAGLWRLDVNVAGSGVTGDLLAHCIDIAMWLNGGIDQVTAMTETFVKERPHNLTGRVEKVGIDDASAFLARFRNGSLATFEATRYARGHKALYTLEINGEHASISGICTTCIASRTSIIAMRAACADGARSMLPTATIPTCSTGGCQAYRLATSIRSFTRWPIFCKGWGKAGFPDPVSGMDWLRIM